MKFKVSVPSFIFPGTYLENVERIARITGISGVELLFFENDSASRELFLSEKSRICSFTEDLTFTMHLPPVISANHSVLVEISCDFVSSYVVHPPLSGPADFPALLCKWQERFGNIFYLENTVDGSFSSILKELPDIPVCLDTGHLLLQGDSPVKFIDKYGPRIKKIHLNGINGGRGHSLFDPEERWFQEILPFLGNFNGILHLELFEEENILKLMNILGRYGIL